MTRVQIAGPTVHDERVFRVDAYADSYARLRASELVLGGQGEDRIVRIGREVGAIVLERAGGGHTTILLTPA